MQIPDRRLQQKADSFFTWKVGPYHSLLMDPMALELGLEGEQVVSCGVETGFLEKGLEKAMRLNPWSSLIPYSDHLDPEGAIFGEWSVCLAVEKILCVIPPERAQWIRSIVAELTRLSLNCHFFIRIARSVGAESFLHYVLRDREKILDLFELLTGSRFTHHFLRVGGVAYDTTDGFLDRVLALCGLIQMRVQEYRDVLIENPLFLQRSQKIGTLSSQQILEYGVTGPNAYASGVFQIPVLDSPCLVERQKSTSHSPSSFQSGDVYSRVCVRLEGMMQSTLVLEQLCEDIPSGEFFQPNSFPKKIPSGKASVALEGARGILRCHLSSEKDLLGPAQISFDVPTLPILSLLSSLLVGSYLEDVPLILASLDLCLSEVDR